MAKGSRGGRRSGVAPNPGRGASISQSNTPARQTGTINATTQRTYQTMAFMGGFRSRKKFWWRNRSA